MYGVVVIFFAGDSVGIGQLPKKDKNALAPNKIYYCFFKHRGFHIFTTIFYNGRGQKRVIETAKTWTSYLLSTNFIGFGFNFYFCD